MTSLRLLFLLFSLIFSDIIAQDNAVIVEYNYIPGNYENEASNNYLYLKENQNFFLLYGSAGKELKFENIKDDFKRSKISLIIKHLAPNKFLYSGYMTPPKRYFTEDNAPIIHWNIKNESKNILGYKCQKGEGYFRGRKWIAWFTPEISSQLGPWKLGGLPGLILEAYTDTDEYKYTARRLILNSKLEIPKEIFDYIEEKERDFLSYQDYISKENEFIKSIHNQQLSDMPKGSTMIKQPLRHAQIEYVFEWEKEEPKKP